MSRPRRTPSAAYLDTDYAGFPDDTPIAFMFGLPMMKAEALAYADFEAGTATPAQLQVLLAWKVKMTLVHGTGVGEDLYFLN